MNADPSGSGSTTLVAEPEPVDPKLFGDIRAGAIISYFGSGTKNYLLNKYVTYNVISLEDARIKKKLNSTTTEKYFLRYYFRSFNVVDQIVFPFYKWQYMGGAGAGAKIKGKVEQELEPK